MWSALRTLLRFLFSRTAVILIIGTVVVSAVALWLFAQHHLDERRDQVEQQRQRVEQLSHQVLAKGNELKQLAQDREALAQGIDQAETVLLQERDKLSTRIATERTQARQLGADIEEVNQTMALVAERLEAILRPFEEANWLPDVVQNQAGKWRTRLEELSGQRKRLTRRKQRAELAASQASEQVRDLVETTAAHASETRLEIQRLAGLEDQHRAEFDPLENNWEDQRHGLISLEQALDQEEQFVAGAS